jgi:hypothetical protein
MACIVMGLFGLCQRGFVINELNPALWAGDASCRDPEWEAQLVAARTSWGSAIFVATAIMITLAASALGQLARALQSHRLALGIASAAGLAGIWLVLHAYPAIAVPPLQMAEGDVIYRVSQFDPRPPLVVFLSALAWTSLLIALALGSLMPRIQSSPSLDELQGMRRFVRAMLTGTTLWLVVGVLGIGLYHRMAAAHVVPEAADALNTIGASSTVFAGALYSALIAAVFGPVELMMRRAARRIAPTAKHPKRSTEEWLSKQGFEISVLQELRGVLAVLGPLLAGMAQGIAELK